MMVALLELLEGSRFSFLTDPEHLSSEEVSEYRFKSKILLRVSDVFLLNNV